MTTALKKNDIGLCGIDFVEFCSPSPHKLEELFLAFGFSKIKHHKEMQIDYFKQHDIHFFLNQEKGSHADVFADAHGPCISSMAWRFKDPEKAYKMALERGATPAHSDYYNSSGADLPAVMGIGGSIIYFVSEETHLREYQDLGFTHHPSPIEVKDKGFLVVDHLTNNVHKGTMSQWGDFYKNVFGFEEVRYFDIRGVKTGLTSYALRSPCGSFCIPINEAEEKKSQINEYLEEYKGPGVQHLAFLTDDILTSLDGMQDSRIQTLDIDDDYYSEIFNKFPQVTEDHSRIRNHSVLIDGDDEGYLLQIFTKNLIGPIFIEIIQRKNHHSFGEGNFGALFRSIERDQMKRGVLT